MTRDEAATYVGERLGAYLSAASRTASDAAGGLKPAIDDALRALGYAEADLATAEPDALDMQTQVTYRALVQIKRDLGPTFFNVSTGGDSYSLQAVRAAVEKDVEEAKAAVLERFGTLGVIGTDSDSLFVTLDLNTLEPTWAEVLA